MIKEKPSFNVTYFELVMMSVKRSTKLSLSDVIDMTETSNTRTLTILGDSADKVTVDSTLTKASSTETINGNTFDIYTHASTGTGDPTVIVKIEQVIQDN